MSVSDNDGRRVWVLDGGLATELERKGHNIANDRLWSARLLHSDPKTILDVHKSYLDNGADIIITASYQASVEGFCSELGVSEDEALNLIGRSVAIAKEARKQHTSQKKDSGTVMIAGSVGPYGACQHDGSEYTGCYVDHMTKQELQTWHRPRMKALEANGVDIIAFETIPALLEARALIELLYNEFPNTKAWITFSCKDGEKTCHGEYFTDAVSAVLEDCRKEQIIAVGVNCTAPGHIQSLLRYASHVTDRPLIVYPNSGETWNTDTHSWSGNSMSLSSEALSWIELGARYIGGCCRVGPHDIHDLRHTIDQYHDNHYHKI